MSLVNLMHLARIRRVDDSSHQMALDETLTVNRNDSMKIHAAWPTHAAYELSAFVISDFGHVSIVSLDGYGTEKVSQSVCNGAVKHAGQSSHGFPKHTEQVIELRLTDRTRMIIPVLHTKYFEKHTRALANKVTFKITNDNGLDVSMDPAMEPTSSHIYSFSPCIIRNGPDGITIHSWGKYPASSTYFAPVYDIERHELHLETKEI
jgi:hypothetical protein